MADVNNGTDIRELVIVGSGPAGYTAGVYAGRAQLKPLLYEGSVTAGGALMNTTEVKTFLDFQRASWDQISWMQCVNKLRALT